MVGGRYMKSFFFLSGPHFRVPEPVDCISFKFYRITNVFQTNGQGFSYFHSGSELEFDISTEKNIKGLNKVQFNKKGREKKKHSLSSN